MPPDVTDRASCMYSGSLVHRRVGPIVHEFRYRISLLCLDLNEAAHLDGLAPLWGYERRAPISIRRCDYLGDPRVPLGDAVRELVALRTGARPGGSIRLLTSPRVLGYSFNPISLYFCHGADGGMESIVAEVTNTPWRERHCYVLTVPEAHRDRTVYRFVTPKEMHVSPFLGMDHDYHWRIGMHGGRLSVAIAAANEGKRSFSATMMLTRAPLRRRTLFRTLLHPPLGALGATAAIHLQALRLWRKGVTFHPHPRHASAQDVRTGSGAGRRPDQGRTNDDRACAA